MSKQIGEGPVLKVLRQISKALDKTIKTAGATTAPTTTTTTTV